MSETAIRTESLGRDFKTVRALDGLNLEVPAGIVFGFLGPNGAGKTTTIRLLLGLLEPSRGRAEILGRDIAAHGAEVRALSGALLEQSGLYERLSAAGIFGLTFLVAVLASGLGVLVSLRAATVRQAQQTFSIAFLLMFIPLFVLPMLPAAVKAKLLATVSGLEAISAALVVVALLVVTDAVILLVADVRFRRNRLILD